MSSFNFNSFSFKASAFILLIIIFTAVSLGLFSFYVYRGDSIQYQSDKALAIANSVAGLIDADEISKVAGSMEKTPYYEVLQTQINEIKRQLGLEYLYVAVANSNPAPGESRLMYFIDAVVPGQDEDTIAYLGDTDSEDAFAAEAYRCFDTARADSTDIYDSEGYGYMVSGYGSVTDQNGKTVAVVCVDINVDDVLVYSNEFGEKIIQVVIGVCMLLIVFSLWLVIRVVIRPIKEISGAARRIAGGDTAFRINVNTRDEIGNLAYDVMQVSGTMQQLTESLQANAQAQMEGDFEARIDSSPFRGVFRRVADEINSMTERQAKETVDILNVVQSIGDGDFCKPLYPLPGKKAVANTAVENLRGNLTRVSNEIHNLVDGANSGNLAIRIKAEELHGDWNGLALDLNSLVQAVYEPMDEAARVMQDIADGKLGARVTGTYKGDFAVIKSALNEMATRLSGYIDEVQSTLASIAANQMDCEVTGEYVGQFSGIKDSINKIIDHLNKLIGEMVGHIGSTSALVSANAASLSDTSKSLAAGALQEAEAVARLKDGMDKINTQTELNAQNVTAASEIAEKTSASAVSGQGDMEKLLTAMDAISEATKSIERMNKVIESIAEQTNLLALNASVEAARAGQYGAGFAVVANEVRDLALKSQVSVKDTVESVELSMRTVQEGIELANSTSTVFREICGNIQSMSGLVERLAETFQAQEQSIAGINRDVEEISHSAMENSASSQQTMAIAEELEANADDLNNQIQKFAFKAAPPKERIRLVAKGGGALED